MLPHPSRGSQSLTKQRCIFQDDLQDWATEASRMRDVFSKADFCIAATGAESGDVGLFFDRDFEQLTPVVVESTRSNRHDLFHWPTPGLNIFGFHDPSAYEAIDNAPLNRRAWVAQERFLSPRTLHFTQSLLFWECYTCLTHENDAELGTAGTVEFSKLNRLREKLIDVQRPECSDGPMQDITLHNTSNDTRLTTPREIYKAWCGFLMHYTSCGITKESDILVALVGVADQVGHAMSDCLVAGLWQAHLIEELCWRSCGRTSRPSFWRAPSWSWASLSGRILPSVYKYDAVHEMAAVIELCVSKKPSGEVEQGSVVLECRPIPITIFYRRSGGSEENSHNAWGALDKSLIASVSEGPNPWSHALIDVQLDVTDVPCYNVDQAVDVQLLVLLEHERESYDWMELQGICVVDSKNQVGAFERVGYFETKDAATKLLLAAYDEARVQTIFLV